MSTVNFSVKHRSELSQENYWVCSGCGWFVWLKGDITPTDFEYHYCPKCRAEIAECIDDNNVQKTDAGKGITKVPI